jgi:hypothetical protein
MPPSGAWRSSNESSKRSAEAGTHDTRGRGRRLSARRMARRSRRRLARGGVSPRNDDHAPLRNDPSDLRCRRDRRLAHRAHRTHRGRSATDGAAPRRPAAHRDGGRRGLEPAFGVRARALRRTRGEDRARSREPPARPRRSHERRADPDPQERRVVGAPARRAPRHLRDALATSRSACRFCRASRGACTTRGSSASHSISALGSSSPPSTRAHSTTCSGSCARAKSGTSSSAKSKCDCHAEFGCASALRGGAVAGSRSVSASRAPAAPRVAATASRCQGPPSSFNLASICSISAC